MSYEIKRGESTVKLVKTDATRGGVIHLTPEGGWVSLCLLFTGYEVNEALQDKEVTCKRCLKKYEKLRGISLNEA